jgi:hypothetical protein
MYVKTYLLATFVVAEALPAIKFPVPPEGVIRVAAVVGVCPRN